MWVAACLFVGLEDTYKLLRGEMTAEQAEQFYRSAWPLGTTLQVTDDQWPATRAEFDTYWDDACQRVVIDAPVRDYLLDLINLRMINPASRAALPAAAEVPHHRLPRSRVQGRVGCAVEQGQAAPLRMAVPSGGVRQPVPAGVHPSGRQLHRPGRRAQTGPRAQQPGVTDVTGLRRLLSRKVSIEAMIEFAMWIAIPYLVIGIVWTFFNADDVARIESQLETRIPAGSESGGVRQRRPRCGRSCYSATRSVRPDA